jgi:hypothetical protein
MFFPKRMQVPIVRIRIGIISLRASAIPFVWQVATDAESASAVSEIELDCFSTRRGLVKATRLYFGTRPNIGFIGAIAFSFRSSLISVERAPKHLGTFAS